MNSIKKSNIYFCLPISLLQCITIVGKILSRRNDVSDSTRSLIESFDFTHQFQFFYLVIQMPPISFMNNSWSISECICIGLFYFWNNVYVCNNFGIFSLVLVLWISLEKNYRLKTKLHTWNCKFYYYTSNYY